ncbi:hypothetical protein [Novacetimonas pomaceti]|uniref:hypothetical protein n=1 Tax=Novacetimonas pomaceti TaxID=2021998 RepID=UPI001EF027BE|nr:hypothetical protein [Novacetimonas pomaceti]
MAKLLGDRLWIAPSCSQLHVPVDLAAEEKMDAEINSWLAFAVQNLDEIRVLALALDRGAFCCDVRTGYQSGCAGLTPQFAPREQSGCKKSHCWHNKTYKT